MYKNVVVSVCICTGDYNNPLYNQIQSAPPDYQQLHTYSTIPNPDASEYTYTVPHGAVGQPPTTTVQVVKTPPVQVS